MTTRKLMRQVGLSGNSDVMNGTGSYPGLFGFDFSDIVSKGKNFTNHIKFAYEQGAVIEFDWLADNPATTSDCDSKCYKDTDVNACSEIVKGEGGTPKLIHPSTLRPTHMHTPGDVFDTWTGWLDTIAENLRSYKHEDGTPIPIVFRFLHETSGRLVLDEGVLCVCVRVCAVAHV